MKLIAKERNIDLIKICLKNNISTKSKYLKFVYQYWDLKNLYPYEAVPSARIKKSLYLGEADFINCSACTVGSVFFHINNIFQKSYFNISCVRFLVS